MKRENYLRSIIGRNIKKCVTVSIASVFLASSVVVFNPFIQGVQAKQVKVAKGSDEASISDSEIPETSKGAFEKYKQIEGINQNTILGADFTNYQQCLGWEKIYKNYMSQPVDDIFSYVKDTILLPFCFVVKLFFPCNYCNIVFFIYYFTFI